MLLYEKFFMRLEKVRWRVETDIDWAGIQPDLLSDYQKESIANICKTEMSSLFAAEAFIRDFYDDIDFSCFVSIWYYEEMKHCLVLKKYLSHVGVEIPEDELQQMRMSIPPYDKQSILMIHFLSEHRLAMWYNGFGEWLPEPVGKDIFKRIAEDELRHANGYFEYMQKDLAKHPEHVYTYLRTASFMLSPKAPIDTHAVTITKTTEQLADPHYIAELEELLEFGNARETTNKRIYSLLSLLSGENIVDYKSLISAVRKHKKSQPLPDPASASEPESPAVTA